MHLHKAPWYEVPKWWPAVSRWVEEALSRSLRWEADDLYSACLRRRMTLWLALDPEPKGVAITHIEHFRHETGICTVLVVGGEGMKDWLMFKNELEDHARANSCDVMEAWGRRGWARVLDYEPVYTIYRKVL